MATTNGNEYVDNEHTRSNFFYRSLSPFSFERLHTEHSDYFYKPKRGPSTSKSNITITRPIKTFETVTKLFKLLSKENNHIKGQQHVQNIEPSSLSQKLHEQKSSSHCSSLISMDDEDSSSSHSSRFSSRSNSSISTVPDHESQLVVIEEASPQLTHSSK